MKNIAQTRDPMDTSSSANPDAQSGSPNQRVEGGTPEDEQPSHTAEEYVQSGRQMVLEALGSLYNTAESANLCLYCGSTQHEHFECDHPGRDAIKNALNKIRECMHEGEPATAEADESTVDPSGSGQNVKTDAAAEEEISDEEDDPSEGQMYDKPIYMCDVGDRDELGRGCIAGLRVDQRGPTTRDQINEVVREALMRGTGDRWNVADFYKNSSDISKGRSMYEEITHYMNGFFQIVPTNQSTFHYGLYGFCGVEYGKDYKPHLNKYESEVSWKLNTALRHHAGKEGRNAGYGLKCDDAGWVLLESILDYKYIWDHRGHREIERLYHYEPASGNTTIDPEVAYFPMKTLFKIMHHCVAYGRRVRVQILAFGINRGVNVSDAYLRQRGVTATTEIPE